MRKFAYSILGIFILLGGVLLGACQKQVSLSVSTNDVVIYTNDSNQENYQSKEIEVSVENSNVGVRIEIEEGSDCIETDKTYATQRKANGNYSFKILTKQDKKSGNAKVRVLSIDDPTKSEIINVSVKTILEKITTLAVDSETPKTDRFAVRGVAKQLDVNQYFDPDPITANVADIDWSFEEQGSKSISIGGQVAATIDENDVLLINENYTSEKIVIRATFKQNASITSVVELAVLDNSTINSLYLSDAKTGQDIYAGGEIILSSGTFNVKRNNREESKLEGTMTINTSYNVTLGIEVYDKATGKLLPNQSDLTEEERETKPFVEKFFAPDVQLTMETTRTKTYSFVIDSYDNFGYDAYGSFLLYFKVSYDGYYYDIKTDKAQLTIEVEYAAERVEVKHNGYAISQADIFSSYNDVRGFSLVPVVERSDIPIDNNNFRFSIDTQQVSLRQIVGANPIGQLASFVAGGRELTFTPSALGSAVYVSEELVSTTEVYVLAKGTYDNVQIVVESMSNPNVNTSLYVYFYEISPEQDLIVKNSDDSDVPEVTYMSTSQDASRRVEYELKVNGVTSLAGLELITGRMKNGEVVEDNVGDFDFSGLTLKEKYDVENEKYIIVEFSVEAERYNFADDVYFWFKHITGKMSAKFKVSAFVPITKASVQNLDKSSADLYIDHSQEQAFALVGTEIVLTALPVNSVSKLMVEAGTNLSLSTNCFGATLSEDGVAYKYLPYEEIEADMAALHIEVDYDIFDETDLETASKLFDYYKFLPFETETLFTINPSTLQIGDNAFKGFVCVLFGGYDDNHEKVTLARFFALESFYSVKYLSSNVTNKLLYTTTSLSEKDIDRSYVDVRLTLRPDAKTPTYAGGEDDLDRLNFATLNAEWTPNSNKDTYLDNTYYIVSGISFKEGGRYIDFKITANSTNLQSSYKDWLTVTYRDGNGINKKTEIQIEIKNAKRIESVVWLNRTMDDVIYMDARSTASNATNFTISTSVLPNDANDVRLTPVYSGSQSDFTITTSTIGQTVNLTINKKMAGTGYLYLIPTDMIKIVDGTEKILLYKYEDNDTIEIPNYDVRLSRLDSYYDNIVTGNGDLDVSPYFLNNDGERVYYSDVILRIKVVIADGSNEELAIRIYGQTDLEEIDPTLYYEIANDITLTDWKSKEVIYKQIDGKNHTITFTKGATGSEAFVDSLEGKIKNLTFTGEVEKDHISMANTRYSGFIANIVQSTGSIENCSVDVYSENNSYKPSKLVSGRSVVGAIAGQNNGIVADTYVYGVDIEATMADVGGLVGENKGTIRNCGVEFYKFQGGVSNKVEASTNFGGIVGILGVGRIERSYVYDYTDGNVATASNKYPLVGYIANAGAYLSEVFAYFADEIAANPFGTAAGVSVNINNGYIAFENGNTIKYYTTSGLTEESDLNDTAVWAEGGNTNFGHKYLANVLPSENILVENVRLDDVSVLNGQRYKAKSVDGLKGVLFNYRPTSTIVLPHEKSALDNYNTINVTDLFVNYVEIGDDVTAFETGVVYYTKLGENFVQVAQTDAFDPGLTYYTKEKLTDRQAKSLLMTSESRNIVLSNDSLKVADTTTREFTISVHLKMDYSQAQEFTFVVVNAMPTLTTTIDGVELQNNQTILLQKTKTRNVYYSGVNAVSLAGTMYALESDRYEILYSGADEHVALTKAGNSLILRGLALSENNFVTRIETKFTIEGIASDYQNAVGIERNFGVSVFTGATALSIQATSTLNVTPSDHAPFAVLMTTDNVEDNLVFSLINGEVEIEAERGVNETTFRVDSNLVLDVVWTKVYLGGNDYRFNVLVRIKPEYRHLVDKDYDDLILQVNAATQNDNTQYMKSLPLSVGTQVLNDVSIRIYGIKSRQVKDSILYITRANDPITTIAPATDAIVAVIVDPAYAKMTHFKLTYSMFVSPDDQGDGKEDGDFGAVSISRIVYDKNNGYHTDLSAARLIENGILVNLTDADRTGDGIYYFRIYASNSFSGKPKHVKFTAEFFDGETSLRDGGSSRELIVSALNEAEVLVDGASTCLIAKGQSAEVTVAVNPDQTLYSLYLQNNQRGIILSTPTYDIVDGVKTYRATLSVGLDSLLTTGLDTGMFYVCATVERVINGIQEFKSSRAAVCLTDFTIDLEETRIAGSTRQLVYNGESYDAIYAYINEERELKFDYAIEPDHLEYDKNDANQVRIAKEIERKRNEFLLDYSYGDDQASYYINYQFNENTGTFDKMILRQQLWYASSRGNVTKFYNDNYHSISQNDYFNVYAPDESSMIKITGKRAGSQLMMLRTLIYYQGIEFTYDYYFLVRVEVWTDEDAPLEIKTAEEFIDKATNGDTAAHYVLTSDIVLEDYTPVSTELFDSLDGNGYTIHINSFKMPEDTSTLRLALFDTVTNNTLLKNVRVNIYNGGQITVNYKRYTDIKIAGFAVTNNGIIYNSEVVAYYDGEYQASRLSGETGLIVKYVKSDGADPVQITEASNIDSVVAGFVIENEVDGESGGTIVNSRVGGDETLHFVELANRLYLEHIELDILTIEGQGNVSGFVGTNSGYVSASYAKKMQIYNNMSSVSSKTAGFAIENSNMIQNSYVEALGGARDANNKIIPYNNLSNMSTMGVAAGFVYENKKDIRNSYANIAIDNVNAKSYMASGFVYINDAEGSVELCYAACEILRSDVGEMQFTGVNNVGTSLNYGKVNTSYFYNETKADDSNESKVGSGAVGVNDVKEQSTFYGFSFASDEDSYDGIWAMREEGITLVSANKIALSNRYVKQVSGSYMTSVFYNNFVTDFSTYSSILIKYGSQNNPFIIKSAADFAKATGSSEISVYKEFFSADEVFGNAKAGLIVSYRLVSSINMDEIGQSESSTNKIKLTTTKKVLSNGLIDGNGFTIENINLGSNNSVESFGLFAKVKDSVIMNLNLMVESVHDDEANVVGVLAGEAINTRILAIDLRPTTNAESHTAVKGKNLAGGVVGMLLGDSFISDITVSSIDIEAVYFARNKQIDDNAKDISGRNNNGNGIRDCVDHNISFVNNIKTLSYAGAVVGFVDIYNKYSNSSTIYSTTLTVNDYNIVTVRVRDSVNIYAETVGGLFGYVGKSTKVYDASIELNADMYLNNPSYIVSKNLFAGGLIGENYGGLHAVYARYTKELQDSIEKNGSTPNQYAYNNGDTSVERGQSSIFSYTSDEDGYNKRTNNPKYIGGLVGYMGGGFMYVAYNKLNVVSNNEKTENETKTFAVGGIVGLVGPNSTFYALNFMNRPRSVNILFYDVYASGDVYGKANTFSGGIIGSMTEVQQSALAFKNVLAVNYYSNAALENMGNHAMLIGGDVAPTADLYIIDNYNNAVLNVLNGDTEVEISLTVGGFKVTKDGETMKVFGFALKPEITELQYTEVVGTVTLDDGRTYYKASDATGWEKVLVLPGEAVDPSARYYVAKPSILDSKTLWVDDIESDITLTYAKMTSYFIERGWEEKYWIHNQDTLYPEIELLPRLLVLYWDHYNTEQIIDAMKTGSPIIVVRGRINEANEECKDIDLTDLTNKAGAHIDFDLDGKAFTGKLYSHFAYMNTLDGAKITEETKNGDVLIGGTIGQGAGIILNEQMFPEVSSNALISGVSFYIKGSTLKGPIVGSADRTTLRDCQVVISSPRLTIEECSASLTGSGGTQFRVASTLVGLAKSSTLINNNVRFREFDEANSVHVTFKQIDEPTPSDNDVERNYGIVVGYFYQTGTFMTATMQGSVIQVQNLAGQMGRLLISVNKQDEATGEPDAFYFGGHVGHVEKHDGAKLSANFVTYSIDTTITIEDGIKATNNETGMYIGAYAGYLKNVDEIKVEKDNTANVSGDKTIYINYKGQTTNLYLGAMFGFVHGEQSLEVVGQSDAKVTSVITNVYTYVEDGETQTGYGLASKTVSVGGFIGKIANNASIAGFNIDTQITFAKWNESDTTNWDYSIGGVIGLAAAGKSLTLANFNDVKVDIAVETAGNLNVGGMIGKTLAHTTQIQGSITVNANNSEDYKIDVKAASVNVGGVIGVLKKTATEEGNFVGSSGYNLINVDVTTIATHVVFGGVIGSVEGAESMNVQRFIYSGKFEHKVSQREVETLVVGGIIGQCDEYSQGINISQTLSLGDVFVDYSEIEDSEKHPKLDSYTFGGVVGVAPATTSTKNVTLDDVYSLLTNYNNRTTYWSDGHAQLMNVGALVGANASQVNYAPVSTSDSETTTSTAYYSSGVVLAYQEEGGIDKPYFSNSDGSVVINYKGYSSEADLTQVTPQTQSIFSTYGGISYLDGLSMNLKGMKLNPVLYTSTNTDLSGADSHGITWVAMGENITASEPIGELDDIAFVGNGFVFTRDSGLEADEDYASSGAPAGFATRIGHNGRVIISNLLINAQISEDITGEEFGGVVGVMEGESFIYGVGVNGFISVGGTHELTLSGIVGKQRGGWISNCYVDADIIYRAKADSSSQLSGITYIPEGSEFVSVTECYTSGSLTPYAKCHLAKILFAEEGDYGDAFDLYTITRIDETKIFASADVTDEDKVIYGTTNFSYQDNNLSDGYVNKAMTRHNFTNDTAQAKTNQTKRKLYYDRAVNYGYGTLPFGFMRVAEIKAFTRNPSEHTADATTGKETYTYQKYGSLDDIDDNTYYEIPNLAKFEDMLDYMVEYDANLADAKFKFVLKYDVDVSTINITKLGSATASADFVFDGQNHNLQNYGTTLAKLKKSLFKEIKGKLINLRMTGINIDFDTSEDDIGVLASAFSGSLNNLHLEGDITNGTNGAKNVGGLVGRMTGTAKMNLVEAILNITSTKSVSADTDNNSRIAGLVGYMENGTITNSSNNGIIKNESTGSCDVVAAGIVGRMDGGEINNVYNGNAVLASFTGTHDMSSYAGGIVGYANKGTAALKILNAYNIALVGAGNYEVKEGNDSYAGGIFAKAEGTIVVESCQNDGAVQALSHIYNDRIENSDSDNTRGQSIEITQQKSGVSELGIANQQVAQNTNATSLTNNPQYLIFKVKTQYNVKKNGNSVVAMDRQVYANGIGNGGTFSKELNRTSKDNIKNDGNIGQKEETKYIVFDRYAVLNNDDKFVTESNRRNGTNGSWRVKTDNDKSGAFAYDYSFYGVFTYQNDGSLVATTSAMNYTENGQDGYGFVKRLYMVDGIQRQYGQAWNGSSYGNEILYYYDHFMAKQSGGYHNQGRIYYSSASGATSDGDGNVADVSININKAAAAFNNSAPYTLKGALVKYAESVSFSGYETYIDEETLTVAQDYGDVVREEVEDGPKTIDQLVAGINTLFENSEGTYNVFSVGGTENVAITHSSDNYTAVTSPVAGSVEAVFELDDPSTIDEDSIKVVFSGDYQFIDKQYPLDFSASTSTKKIIKAKAEFKYGNNNNATVNAEVTYRRIYENVLLTKTNVTKTGNNTTISFDEGAGGDNFKKQVAETVIKAQADGERRQMTDLGYSVAELRALGYTDADMAVKYKGSYSAEIDGVTYRSSTAGKISLSIGTEGVPQIVINDATLAGKNLIGKEVKLNLDYVCESAIKVTLTAIQAEQSSVEFNLSDDKYFAKEYDFDAYYELDGSVLDMNNSAKTARYLAPQSSGNTHYIKWAEFLEVVKESVVDVLDFTNYSNYVINQIVLAKKSGSSYTYAAAYQSADAGGYKFEVDPEFGSVSGSVAGGDLMLTANTNAGSLGSADFHYFVNVNLDANSTTHTSGTIEETSTDVKGYFSITVRGILGNRKITDGAPRTIGSENVSITFIPKTVRYTRGVENPGDTTYDATVTITTNTGNLGWIMESTDNGIRQQINQTATQKQVYYVSGRAYNKNERIKISYGRTTRTISPSDVTLADSGGRLEFVVASEEKQYTTYNIYTGIADNSAFYGEFYDSTHSYVKTAYLYDTDPDKEMPTSHGSSSPDRMLYQYDYYVFDNGGFAISFSDSRETKYVYSVANNTLYEIKQRYKKITNVSQINYDYPMYMYQSDMYLPSKPTSVTLDEGGPSYECHYDENGVPDAETQALLNQYYQNLLVAGYELYNGLPSEKIPKTKEDYDDLMNSGFWYKVDGQTTSGKGSRTIYLDVIAGSTGNQIVFIRNKNRVNLVAEDWMEKESNDVKYARVSLYEGTSTFVSHGDAISYGVGTTNSNTTSDVIYPLSYVSTFVSENAAGDTLTAIDYLDGDSYKFDIVQNHQANLEGLSVTKTGGATIVPANYILLTDNLYSTKSVASGDKKLYADGHIINAVLTEDKSLFARNSTLIDSGVFVVHRQIGEISLGNEISMFIAEKQTGSEVQNARLYGSYRNAQKNVGSVTGDNYAKVYTIAKESISGITSSVSVNVLDATDSASSTVGVKLFEKQESKDILVSGDGYRGVDGTDGTQSIQKADRNGISGTAGGNGGQIDLGTDGDAVTCGFARGGADGVGGLGGDGANAFYEQTNSSQLNVIPTTTYAKGEGGAAGASGDGTTAIHARVVGTAEKGLDGLGGFGRIYASSGENGKYFVTNSDSQTEWKGIVKRTDGTVTGAKFGNVNSTWTTFAGKEYIATRDHDAYKAFQVALAAAIYTMMSLASGLPWTAVGYIAAVVAVAILTAWGLTIPHSCIDFSAWTEQVQSAGNTAKGQSPITADGSVYFVVDLEEAAWFNSGESNCFRSEHSVIYISGTKTSNEVNYMIGNVPGDTGNYD